MNSPDSLPFLQAADWLDLLLASYLLHFGEEFWCGGGYPAYLLKLRGISISRARFVALQAFGFALLLTGTLLSLEFGFPQLMLVMFSGIILANGLTHTLTASWHREYGPGLVVSVLWIPLGAFLLLQLYGRMPIGRFVTGLAIGVSIQVVIAIWTILGTGVRNGSGSDRGVSA